MNICPCAPFSSSRRLSMLCFPALLWTSSPSSTKALKSSRSWNVLIQVLWHSTAAAFPRYFGGLPQWNQYKQKFAVEELKRGYLIEGPLHQQPNNNPWAECGPPPQLALARTPEQCQRRMIFSVFLSLATQSKPAQNVTFYAIFLQSLPHLNPPKIPVKQNRIQCSISMSHFTFHILTDSFIPIMHAAFFSNCPPRCVSCLAKDCRSGVSIYLGATEGRVQPRLGWNFSAQTHPTCECLRANAS